MLSKTRGEDSHVKTVSLARGTVTTPAIGIPLHNANITSAPHHRRSLERSVTGRSSSPDTISNGARDGQSGMTGMLNSIGIIELLEQDERPTFIVDLGDSSNYGPGQLHLLFANLSLKQYDGIIGLVTGQALEESSPGSKTFLQFKSWLLSAAVNGESLNVCLPPFSYANMTWSCSTLRKRLRIISGAFNTPPASATAAMRVSIPPGGNISEQLQTVPEVTDYFGETGQDKGIPDIPSSSNSGILPTTEAGHAPADGAFLRVPPDLDLSGAMDLLPNPSTYVQPSLNAGAIDLTPGAMSGVSSSTSGQSRLANDGLTNSQITTVSSDSPSFDWTRLPVTDSMPKHIQFARSIDWASTSLGPIEDWSSDLRQMCNLIMASPHPAAMYWGDDLVSMEHEKYRFMRAWTPLSKLIKTQYKTQTSKRTTSQYS